MFRVPINGPADVFCDNQSVVTNVSIPSSVLNKKHNSICYHRVREAHKAGTIRVGWISGQYNKAKISTKKTICTKRRYEIPISIYNDKVYTITNNYYGDDGETQIPLIMEVSKCLLYGEKPSLKAGSENEF